MGFDGGREESRSLLIHLYWLQFQQTRLEGVAKAEPELSGFLGRQRRGISSLITAEERAERGSWMTMDLHKQSNENLFPNETVPHLLHPSQAHHECNIEG